MRTFVKMAAITATSFSLAVPNSTASPASQRAELPAGNVSVRFAQVGGFSAPSANGAAVRATYIRLPLSGNAVNRRPSTAVYAVEVDIDVAELAPPAQETKLYVGNMPFNLDSGSLSGIFGQAGKVDQVDVIYDRETGRSRGFAFVTMAYPEDAEAAIQRFDGTGIGGLDSNHAFWCAGHVASRQRRWQRRGVICAAGGVVGRGSPIKVVVNNAGGELGRAAIRAVVNARGMKLAGVVDLRGKWAGQDAGEMAGLEEPLELPVTGDLIMVLASIANAGDVGVLVDLESGSDAFENIRQATAFGLKSVISGADLDEEKVRSLEEFCDKASTGCILAPTLSIGTALLQQAAVSAAFHYSTVDIIEGRDDPEGQAEPSPAALQVADALSGLGRIYNQQPGEGAPSLGAQERRLEDGVRWQGSHQPGAASCLEVRFAGPGQIFSLRHDVQDPRALMPGLLLAIRKVVRLKTLVYGIEKIL